jgi:hypothetical protein
MVRFPVERGAVISFARSIGDPNPAYYEEASSMSKSSQAIAPPTFSIASAQFDPEFPFRPRIGEPTTAPLATTSSKETRLPGLHAEQHFDYRRHVKVDEVLSVVSREGKRWTKINTRGDTLYFQETTTEYLDESLDVVVVARSVIVRVVDDQVGE